MTQRRVMAAALSAVVVAVIGLLYLQTVAVNSSTRTAWMATRDLAAGREVDAASVKQVRIPSVGDRFSVLEESPMHRRLAHHLAGQTLLTADDLLGATTAEVQINVRASPTLVPGDTVDVYAVTNGRTVLVGRGLIVASGNPLVVLVNSADEPYWVALQANEITLVAARSAGVGVPDSAGVNVADAVASLSGDAQTGTTVTAPETAP
jgi:hypothetical protein